jgi:hypothetical protein
LALAKEAGAEFPSGQRKGTRGIWIWEILESICENRFGKSKHAAHVRISDENACLFVEQASVELLLVNGGIEIQEKPRDV